MTGPGGEGPVDFGYTRADVEYQLHERSNWGRWGSDDQAGAVNLITAQKRAAAAGLVRSGRTVSLSREFPTRPGPSNPYPAQHYLKMNEAAGGSGCALDYYGAEYHGWACTHIDALCHAWDERGMWNGRKPGDVLGSDGAGWAGIENWRNGILTRGVLIDIPAFRGEGYVERDRPVTGPELAAAAAAQDITVEPGDALVVYSGRDRWDEENFVWGGDPDGDGVRSRPGLHASCLEYLRDTDCSVLAWDMMDQIPNPWGLRWTVHGALFAYGLALVDNCDLAPLAAACRQEQRHEFMFVLAPLVVRGGTGSPVNPLAVL